MNSGKMYPPCTDLLTENVFVSPGNSEGWSTIDFKDYDINVPVEGFYIALEFGFSDNFNYKLPLTKYMPSGTVLYPSAVPEESSFWRYGPNTGWYQIPIVDSGFLKYSSKITVELK